MRLLYINSSLMDIDEDTSIGIDFQAYDLKEPAKRKVNISNAFTIPKTANNMAVLGYPGNPHSLDDTIYTIMTCDYWIDNFHLIKNNSVRIEEISDRISLYVSSKNDIWDKLKDYSWTQCEVDYLAWAKDVKGLPVEQLSDSNYNTFLSSFVTATDGIILPFYYGNFLNYPSYPDDLTNIVLDNFSRFSGGNYAGAKGGHFCIYVKSLFEFLEYKFSINFCVNESSITGNIWDDTIASSLYCPARDIQSVPVVELVLGSYAVTGYFLRAENIAPTAASLRFTPLEDVVDKGGKTMFDFVNTFFQKFNCIVDEININNVVALRIARFDDIKTLAAVKDFGVLTGKHSFKPSINGYSQNNYIKIKSLFPEASDVFGSRIIQTLNENLEVKSDLFAIDEYIANFKAITGSVIPDLSIQESFKTFEFFLSNGVSSDTITVKTVYTYYYAGSSYVLFTKTAAFYLPIPVHYSLDNEYLFLEEIIQKPKVYTVKKWLSLRDIYELEFFKQYYIKELNGSFYINKITGFNPQKSNEPTTIELIRISDKTPTPDYLSDYYVDGNDDYFTDGDGNYFY